MITEDRLKGAIDQTGKNAKNVYFPTNKRWFPITLFQFFVFSHPQSVLWWSVSVTVAAAMLVVFLEGILLFEEESDPLVRWDDSIRVLCDEVRLDAIFERETCGDRYLKQ